MKKYFTGFLTKIAIFLLVINSVFPMSVFADESSEMVNIESVAVSDSEHILEEIGEENIKVYDQDKVNLSEECLENEDNDSNEDSNSSLEESNGLEPDEQTEEENTSPDCEVDEIDEKKDVNNSEEETNVEEPTGDSEEYEQSTKPIEDEKNESSDEDTSIEEKNDIKESSSLKKDTSEIRMQSSSYVESKTSKLGHIRNGNVRIFPNETLSNSFVAGSEYTNKVYYIKKQAHIDGKLYYLISNSPSSLNGVVGWVKEGDLSVHNHKGHDKNRKTFYFNGNGKTYIKAWGGSKDIVYNDLQPYEGLFFQVHLTEKVGNNIWYRGSFNGKTMWIHSSYVSEVKNTDVSNTSKLGHIRSGKAKVFKDLSLTSYTEAGTQYTNAVYYIKQQAKMGNKTYYLIGTSPSRTSNTLGWVDSKDLSIHEHYGTDKTPKKKFFTGRGKAFTKAWGGSKDLVQGNMSSYKGQAFEINLTERVGNNIWHRGTLEGETVWLHSSYLTEERESKTSRLGHIHGNAKIYKELGVESTLLITSKYTNAVYYIKKEALINDELFYLLSTSPSATKGVVGWVRSNQVSTHTHNGTNKTPKVFFFTGKGKAYSKAWGGSKDLIYGDMSVFKGEIFNVNLTEKVGNNTWHRGIVEGKTIWVHSSYVNQNTTSNYNITLDQAVDMQMKANPQTDQRYAYVSSNYIDKNNKVTASALNVRSGPGTANGSVGTLNKGDTVVIISQPNKDWYQIEYHDKGGAWVNAARKDVKYYLDPKNFLNDEKLRFQFLDLSRSTNASASKLNESLAKKGVLKGQGQAFIDAANIHGINDLYLISHASLETGNGTSKLATGVEVGKNSKGKLVLVTKQNRNQLTAIKTVYNMYGIQAYDNCALECGAKHAYNMNWTTVKSAIIGGAAFIGDSYIKSGQNTLYKMRWNPNSMDKNGYASHQYATDIGWAAKQITTMYNLYKEFGIVSPTLDVPSYK